jgi:ubiquinone/menaquinone biosynthesis C-methylase UbiE
LDVGGGAGLPGAFMDPGVDYTVVDPSAIWDDGSWAEVRREIGGGTGGTRPRFVRGSAEALPFRDGAFDAALMFWALNHVSDPAASIGELHRVLKPGGTVLLVVEDMEPTWTDVALVAARELRARLWRGAPPTRWQQPTIASARAAAVHKLLGRPWPLQADHMRITEKALQGWFAERFRILSRSWPGEFLTFHLARH